MKKLIENIFSFKKEKQNKNKKTNIQKKKIQIIIDNREKQSLLPAYLSKQCEIKFEQLNIADYIINKTAIERKTLSDFINSIFNKRLFNQLIEIKKYPSYFLIIEGDLEKFKQDKSNEKLINPIKGMILSIITRYEIPIIFTKNEKDTASYILLLAKKQKKSQLSTRPTKSTKSKKELQQFILEGFPSIGPATAKKLLKKYSTLKQIFNANEQELKDILGKKSNLFVDLLD